MPRGVRTGAWRGLQGKNFLVLSLWKGGPKFLRKHPDYYCCSSNTPGSKILKNLAEKSRTKAYKRDFLLKYLRQVAKDLKRVPTVEDIGRLSKASGDNPSSGVYRRFGGLRRALFLAGLVKKSETPRSWDGGEVRQALLRFIKLCEEQGVKPTLAILKECRKEGKDFPSFQIIRKHYKSFKNAMEILGGRAIRGST